MLITFATRKEEPKCPITLMRERRPLYVSNPHCSDRNVDAHYLRLCGITPEATRTSRFVSLGDVIDK